MHSVRFRFRFRSAIWTYQKIACVSDCRSELGVISISRYRDIDRQPHIATISWARLRLRYRVYASQFILMNGSSWQMYEGWRLRRLPRINRLRGRGRGGSRAADHPARYWEIGYSVCVAHRVFHADAESAVVSLYAGLTVSNCVCCLSVYTLMQCCYNYTDMKMYCLRRARMVRVCVDGHYKSTNYQ